MTAAASGTRQSRPQKSRKNLPEPQTAPAAARWAEPRPQHRPQGGRGPCPALTRELHGAAAGVVPAQNVCPKSVSPVHALPPSNPAGPRGGHSPILTWPWGRRGPASPTDVGKGAGRREGRGLDPGLTPKPRQARRRPEADPAHGHLTRPAVPRARWHEPGGTEVQGQRHSHTQKRLNLDPCLSPRMEPSLERPQSET